MNHKINFVLTGISILLNLTGLASSAHADQNTAYYSRESLPAEKFAKIQTAKLDKLHGPRVIIQTSGGPTSIGFDGASVSIFAFSSGNPLKARAEALVDFINQDRSGNFNLLLDKNAKGNQWSAYYGTEGWASRTFVYDKKAARKLSLTDFLDQWVAKKNQRAEAGRQTNPRAFDSQGNKSFVSGLMAGAHAVFGDATEAR